MRDVIKKLSRGVEFGLEDIDDYLGDDGEDRVLISFRNNNDFEQIYVDRSDLKQIKEAINIHINE